MSGSSRRRHNAAPPLGAGFFGAQLPHWLPEPGKNAGGAHRGEHWSVGMRDDDLIGRWVRAADPFDPAALSGLYDTDAVYDDVPVGKVTTGRPEIEALLRQNLSMFPDFRTTEISGFIGEGRGVVQYTMNGTMGDPATADAKEFSVRGASVLEVRDGLIVRQTEYWDLATMLRQLELPMPTDTQLRGEATP